MTAAVLIGFGWRILNEASSIRPSSAPSTQRSAATCGAPRCGWTSCRAASSVLIVVSLLSLAGYVLSFWGYRLTRHPGGTLQVSRGLLTTRATSIEERRLRGVRASPNRCCCGWSAAPGCRRSPPGCGSADRNGAARCWCRPPRCAAVVERGGGGAGFRRDRRRPPLIQHGPAARRRRYTRALGLAGAARRRAVRAAPGGPSWPPVAGVGLAAAAAAGRAAGPRPLPQPRPRGRRTTG